MSVCLEWKRKRLLLRSLSWPAHPAAAKPTWQICICSLLKQAASDLSFSNIRQILELPDFTCHMGVHQAPLFFFFFFFFFYCSVAAAEGIVYIDGKEAIGRIDEDFICATLDWWPPEKCDYGTCSWDHDSLLNLNLNNKILLNAVKAFSPLKIRLGGTLQDKVVYETGDQSQTCVPFVRNASEMFGFTQGCLPMSRWDELNAFFQESGAKIIFGLNALSGRSVQPDGPAVGAWDYTNAESLIRYTVEKTYTIHGWELGNELSGSGVGTRVASDQYADDTKALKNIVLSAYKDVEPKPLVIAPAGFFDANWFKKFIDKTAGIVDVITHHIYNLGPGVDEHLIEKILNPDYLDGEVNTFSSLENIIKLSTSSAVAWVGEAGGAYNSGRNTVTNAFVFSFWYLDQLGMASPLEPVHVNSTEPILVAPFSIAFVHMPDVVLPACKMFPPF